MIELDQTQQEFLEKRRKLVRSWPSIGLILLIGMVATLLWLWIQQPLLINPYEVVDRLESGSIENSTIALMAVMLPLLFLICFVLLMIVVLFAYAAFANEKKHLKIIDILTSRQR